MASIVTNCLDVAKSAFQIHGIDGGVHNRDSRGGNRQAAVHSAGGSPHQGFGGTAEPSKRFKSSPQLWRRGFVAGRCSRHDPRVVPQFEISAS
jgi:hypothetical protein